MRVHRRDMINMGATPDQPLKSLRTYGNHEFLVLCLQARRQTHPVSWLFMSLAKLYYFVFEWHWVIYTFIGSLRIPGVVSLDSRYPADDKCFLIPFLFSFKLTSSSAEFVGFENVHLMNETVWSVPQVMPNIRHI